MTTLALTCYSQQLSELSEKKASLTEALKAVIAEEKAIAQKQQQATKVVSKFETALMQIEKTITELGEAGEELKAITLKKIAEYLPGSVNPEQKSNLVEFPKKENESNSYFTWQPTANENISCYFNVSTGKTQATYVGSNDKNRLEAVGNKLTELLPGISFEVRKAQRLNTTYELKIKRLTDDDLGWLTQFDFTKDFYPQFYCRIQKPEIPEELNLTEKNWIAREGAPIKNNLFPYICYLQTTDNFGTGTARDKQGRYFDIYLDDWHLTPEFYQEVIFTYNAMMACQSKEELEAIKNSNQIEKDMMAFCYLGMVQGDRLLIDKMCAISKKNFKLPSGLEKYQDIAQIVLEKIASFYTITVSKKTSTHIGCWILTHENGAKARLYLRSCFEWDIEPYKKGQDLDNCFPANITDFLANNDVLVDELYKSLAVSVISN